MAIEFSAPEFNDDNSTEYGIPSALDADAKAEVLTEILTELLATLVNDGRMRRAEERMWQAALDAVVLDRPELIEPGGTVIAEAERITAAASRE